MEMIGEVRGLGAGVAKSLDDNAIDGAKDPRKPQE